MESISCLFCSFKQDCWGDKIEYLPQQVFDDEGKPRSKNPRYYWYTHLADRGNNNDCSSREEMSTNESEVDVIFFDLVVEKRHAPVVA